MFTFTSSMCLHVWPIRSQTSHLCLSRRNKKNSAGRSLQHFGVLSCSSSQSETHSTEQRQRLLRSFPREGNANLPKKTLSKYTANEQNQKLFALRTDFMLMLLWTTKNCPKNVSWWSSFSDKFIQSSKPTVQVYFWSTKERSVPTRHSQMTKNKGTLCQHVMSYSSFSYINNWEQESVQVLTCYIRRTLPVSQPGQVPFCYVWFGKIVVAAFKEIFSKSTY